MRCKCGLKLVKLFDGKGVLWLICRRDQKMIDRLVGMN